MTNPVGRSRTHKSQHLGRERLIFIGPKAQQILRPCLVTKKTRQISLPCLVDKGPLGVRARVDYSTDVDSRTQTISVSLRAYTQLPA